MRLLKNSLLIVIAVVFFFGCVPRPMSPTQVDLTKEHKEVKLHGLLGAGLLRLTQDLRDDLKVPLDIYGLVVYAVYRDTVAHKTELMLGDIIQRINGQWLESIKQIAQYPPESTVTLEIWRNGEIKTLNVKLGYRAPFLGIMIQETNKGPKIVSINKDSPFYKEFHQFVNEKTHALHILSLNGVYTKDETSFFRELSKYKPGNEIKLRVQLYYDNYKKWLSPTDYEVYVGESPSSLIPGPVETSYPKTYVVSQDGSGDFKTVAGALLSSSPGDTILLRPGKYENIDILFSHRTIKGERGKTLVNWIGIRGVSDVKVENLTVISQTKDYSAVFVEEATDIFLQGLCVQGGRIAIELLNSKDIYISHCKVSKAFAGIVGGNSYFKVSKSLCFNNTNRNVSVERGSVATLESNTIVDSKGTGIAIHNSQVKAYNNLFAFNPMHIWCSNCNYSGGYNNFFEGKLNNEIKKHTDSEVDPLFMERLSGDYRIRLESPLVNRGRGGTYVGAFPPVSFESGVEEVKCEDLF